MTRKTFYLNEMQSLMGIALLRDYKLTPKEYINKNPKVGMTEKMYNIAGDEDVKSLQKQWNIEFTNRAMDILYKNTKVGMVYKKDYDEVQEKYKLVLLDAPDQFLYLNDNQWIDKDQVLNRLQIMDGNPIDYIIIHKISYHDDGAFVRSKTRVLDCTIDF